MRFKAGQRVYFYKSTGPFMGEIVSATISKATKDLLTGKVVYEVSIDNPLWNFFGGTTTIEAESLYSSKKQIEKEYKEEIIYNTLQKSIDKLEGTLSQVYTELTKDEHKDFTGLTLSVNGEKAFSTVYVNAEDINISGIGSMKEEIEKLKKEIESIKKKIKPKTRKPVVKKAEEPEKEKETPKFTLNGGE